MAGSSDQSELGSIIAGPETSLMNETHGLPTYASVLKSEPKTSLTSHALNKLKHNPEEKESVSPPDSPVFYGNAARRSLTVDKKQDKRERKSVWRSLFTSTPHDTNYVNQTMSNKTQLQSNKSNNSLKLKISTGGHLIDCGRSQKVSTNRFSVLSSPLGKICDPEVDSLETPGKVHVYQ